MPIRTFSSFMSIASGMFLAFCWRKYSVLDHEYRDWNDLKEVAVLTVEHGSIVAAVTLRRKGEAIARVMRECTHESLQRLPHIRRRALSRVRNKTNI